MKGYDCAVLSEKQLSKTICQLEALKAIHQNEAIRSELHMLTERMNDTAFRIAVVGEFSSGKSTFINALLGQDILKHALNETTATITYITNVPAGDPRSGTCEVQLHNGKRMRLQNFEHLAEYTTAQSTQNVAETVLSTQIYLHFLDVNYPVVIVDTPGLNGIADKHRDMTIEEIKRAHACVYLCSVQGIKKSDAEFIQTLLQYQSQFIFVQNFIDALRAGEGDTVQSKLDMIREILSEYIKNDMHHFEYELCGVSALKALAGRDATIRFLYSSDIAPITEQQRETLYLESNFQEFIDILKNFIESGKYKQIVLSSVHQTLVTITEFITLRIELEQEENARLIQRDSRQTMHEIITNRLERLKGSYETNRKKLSNFIIGEDSDNRRELKKDVHEKLEAINQRIAEAIDRELSTYEDYERLSLKQNVGAHFSERASRMVNTELLPKMNSDISTCFSRLYHDALFIAEKYIAHKQVEKKIEFKVHSFDQKFKLQDTTMKQQIQKKEQELSTKKQGLNQCSKSIISDQRSLTEINSDIAEQERLLQQEVSRLENRRSAMGRRPSVSKRIVTETRDVKRGGLLGWLGMKKTETYQRTEYDDSAVRRWDREYQSLSSDIERRRRQYNSEINSLKYQRDQHQTNLSKSTAQKKLIESRIRSLESEINAKKYEQETMMKHAKSELLSKQKKELKVLFEKHLTHWHEGLHYQLEEHIDRSSDKYRPEIEKMVLQQFQKSYETTKAELEHKQKASAEELESVCATSKKEIQLLEAVRKELGII